MELKKYNNNFYIMHNKNNTISILEKSIACFTVDDKNYPLIAKYPNNIMIEVTNACNLKCKMCYHKNMKRKIGFMSEELFRKVIKEAIDLGVENVGLYTTGEAFLHPKIFDFIKIAKQKGINYVYITTNGISLNKDKIQKIIESGLDSIKFSIDSATKEFYEEIKVGASWGKLIANIKLLKKLRDEVDSKLKIFASYLITKGNYNDLFKYNAVFGDLIDETLFSFIDNQGGQVDVGFMIPNEMKEYLNKLITPSDELFPCGLLWHRFIINYDGTLTICCIDFDAKLVYGDLDRSTLRECWNNKKMQKFRKIHRERKFELLPLCHKCNFVKNDISKDREIAKSIKKIIKQGPLKSKKI